MIREELLKASDETIEDAIQYADPMVLHGLLYLLTGDEELLTLEAPGNVSRFSNAGSGWSEASLGTLRSKAVAYLKAYRDSGAGEIELPSDDQLFRALPLTAGFKLPEKDREIWLEESALNPWARGLTWKGGKAPDSVKNFKVAIIGLGLSGLAASVHLKRAGVPFVALEKNADVGGTWFENKYLGARVDTPSRGYTHQFGVTFPYPYAYCPRDENMKYMRWVVDQFGIEENIRYKTEVKSVVWNDKESVYDIVMEGPEGTSSMKANAVISCVGFLSRPQMPEIEGMDSFKGLSFHSARWPDGLDVTGKRVAVVGSGATGYQTTPEISKIASHTYLFQRTPSWCYDDPNYVRPLSPQAFWLDRNFPFYPNFARFRITALGGPDAVESLARIDPNFKDPHARSAPNKAIRDERIAFLNRKLAAKPELIEKMIPNAPPMSSRPIRIDAQDSILDALLRDDVTLVSDKIERITPTGIVAGGVEYPVDIIVYATGFKAQDYLWPMDVRGKGGVTVEQLWSKDGARAYLGAMIPGFPNFWMGYGPNTNNFGGFQVIDLLEIIMRFAMLNIGGLIENNLKSVEVTEEAYWRFNDELDRNEKMMIYMDDRVTNYYQNGSGRSCVNGPVDIRRMWRWMRDPAGTPPAETDAGMRPYFGEDLKVG